MNDGWICPAPLRNYERITIGHGGGGRLGADLIEHLFLPAFGAAALDATPTDAAVTAVGDHRLAFTTDSYVVSPLFFPGGNIGELAVHGTINDLAMAGAQPLALSTAFVLEEGLPLATLERIARAMGDAASAAGARLLTGDTKVVDAGKADGCYITTTGVGLVPPGVDIRPERATPGDRIVLSGPIGLHGMAVMCVREGLEFDTDLRSDTAPLNGLVGALLAAGIDVHTMRDLTRGGLATALCELAEVANVGLTYDDAAVPVPEQVRAACGFLGLDPATVANEGRFVALVAPEDADLAVEVLEGHHPGAGATIIGEVTDQHPGVVAARTPLGAQRVVDRPLGEQLPRIC
jgi:hydrogenase expression/formation protein HypE